MALSDDLGRIAEAAAAHAGEGERVIGVIPAEPATDMRAYLCSFQRGDDDRSWLVLDGEGSPVADRARVRETVTIAALCEIADQTAGGGDLDDLRSQLMSLRLTDNPPGIDAAQEAALALEATLVAPPRLASPAYLDAVGAATLRLEQALGESGSSPFRQAMLLAGGAVEELTAEVERSYKLRLV
jgi:hypothetical protein